jgi:glycine cleavage system H protein
MDASDRRYTKTHEWITEDAGVATMGISNFAVEQLGDIVYIELPEPGKALAAGDGFGDIESVKAVSDLYAPVSGEIVEVNQELQSRPELINESPLEEGWILKLRLTKPDEIGALMSHDQYEKHITEQP